MYAHRSASTRTSAATSASNRLAPAFDDRPAWCPPPTGPGTDLRTRSTPFFRGALAHLILAASQVQRAGGTQQIALRRHELRSPRVLFTAQLDGRELEFVTRADIDGQARVTCADRSAGRRVAALCQEDLGSFESPDAMRRHRDAVAAFLLALRPTLLLDAPAGPQARRPARG